MSLDQLVIVSKTSARNASNHVSVLVKQETLSNIPEAQQISTFPHVLTVLQFNNRKPHLRTACTINHFLLNLSHWRWLSQTSCLHLLLPYWIPRSLISIESTWISLRSEHLKQKQIQLKNNLLLPAAVSHRKTREKRNKIIVHIWWGLIIPLFYRSCLS